MKIKTTFQNLWDAAKAVLSSTKEVYSYTGLSQETRKVSNKQHNLPSKEIRKRTNKCQSQQKDCNSKDQRGNK